MNKFIPPTILRKKILEKDIEDALFDVLRIQSGVQNIWRQVPLSVGRADIIIATGPPEQLVVFEVKCKTVTEKAFTQLLGYMSQLTESVYQSLAAYTSDSFWKREVTPDSLVRGVLVGHDANNMTARAVSFSPNVDFWQYVAGGDGIQFLASEPGQWIENNADQIPEDIKRAVRDVTIAYRNRIAFHWHEIFREGFEEGGIVYGRGGHNEV